MNVLPKLILSFVINQSCKGKENLKASGKFRLGSYTEGKDPWRRPLILLFEAESQFGFKKSLHKLVKPLVSSISLVNADIHDSEYKRIIQHYQQMNDNPHAWPSLVEEASIGIGYVDEGKLETVAEMLTKFPNIHVLTIEGESYFTKDSTMFVSNIQKAMTSHGIQVLDFDDECICDISAIKSFLDTQPNLTTLSIPPPPKDESINVTILGQVLQEITARSGSIRKVTLEGDSVDNQFVLNSWQECFNSGLLEKLVISSCRNVTQSGFKTIFERMITSGIALQQHNHNQDKHKRESKNTDKSLSLRYLKLQNCRISNSAYTLAYAMTYLTSLEYIDTNFCQIDEEHFHRLGPAFAQLPKLATLDLSRNRIGNSFPAIAQGINACKLTKLVLNYTNLTEESNKALACMKLPLLTELSLCSYAGVTSVGAEALSKSLKHMQLLRKLFLRGNRIGSHGTEAISLAFQYTPQLTCLDLENNNICSDGAQAMSASLQYIQQLTVLILSDNNIGSDGAQALSVSLQYIQQLTHLLLSNTNIRTDGVEALSASFQYIPQLVGLDLGHNDIGSKGAQALSASFQYLFNLELLNLSGNPIGPEGVEEIFEHLAHLKCLNKLFLQELSGKYFYASLVNEYTLLHKCIQELKKSPWWRWREGWNENSRKSWFDMVLWGREIDAVNEAVLEQVRTRTWTQWMSSDSSPDSDSTSVDSDSDSSAADSDSSLTDSDSDSTQVDSDSR